MAASSLLAVTMAPVQADTGAPPTVTVGADQVVVRTDTAFLPGVVSDDGLPAPSAVTANWTKVSGPGAVHFSRADEALTTASFDATGDHTHRTFGVQQNRRLYDLPDGPPSGRSSAVLNAPVFGASRARGSAA